MMHQDHVLLRQVIRSYWHTAKSNLMTSLVHHFSQKHCLPTLTHTGAAALRSMPYLTYIYIYITNKYKQESHNNWMQMRTDGCTLFSDHGIYHWFTHLESDKHHWCIKVHPKHVYDMSNQIAAIAAYLSWNHHGYFDPFHFLSQVTSSWVNMQFTSQWYIPINLCSSFLLGQSAMLDFEATLAIQGNVWDTISNSSYFKRTDLQETSLEVPRIRALIAGILSIK